MEIGHLEEVPQLQPQVLGTYNHHSNHWTQHPGISQPPFTPNVQTKRLHNDGWILDAVDVTGQAP